MIDPGANDRTQVYTGRTTEEAEAAFHADLAAAAGAGFFPVTQRWDATQPIPTLVVEFRRQGPPAVAQAPVTGYPAPTVVTTVEQKRSGCGPAIGCLVIILVILIGGFWLLNQQVGRVLDDVEQAIEQIDREIDADRPDTPPAAASDFARQSCAGTTYSRCVRNIQLVMETVPGSLVAICEYGGGEGDIVLLETRGDAEGMCSGDGLTTPSRVFDTIQLP